MNDGPSLPSWRATQCEKANRVAWCYRGSDHDKAWQAEAPYRVAFTVSVGVVSQPKGTGQSEITLQVGFGQHLINGG